MKQCCSKCQSHSSVSFSLEGKDTRLLCGVCSHSNTYPLSALPLLQVCHQDKHYFTHMLQMTHHYHHLLRYYVSLEDQLHSLLWQNTTKTLIKQQLQARHCKLSTRLQDCANTLQDLTCWQQPLSPITHLVIKPAEGTDFAIIQAIALDPWRAFELVLSTSPLKPHEIRVAEAVRWLAYQEKTLISAKLKEIQTKAKNEYNRKVIEWAEMFLNSELSRFEGKFAELPYFLRDLELGLVVPCSSSWNIGLQGLLGDVLRRQCTIQEQSHEAQSLPALHQLLAVSSHFKAGNCKELAFRILAYCRWKARPGLNVQDLALQAAYLLGENAEELAGVFRAVGEKDREEVVLLHSDLGPAQLLRLRDIYSPLH